MTRSALAVLAALSLAAAGCGSSSSDKKTSSSSSSSKSSTGGGAASGGAIKLQNTAFSPKETTVKVGQKITWTNEDGFDHNVTSDSGASFKSKNFGKGGTFTFTPKKAGTIKYECTIHPGMSGVLTVQ